MSSGHPDTRRPDPQPVDPVEQQALGSRLAEVQAAVLARVPEHQVDPSLDAIAALMDLMGQPQRAFPVVHLTGTNGKTSTARMIERLLRELGLRTGRFTSPHLADVRERIAFDGEPIEPARFVAAWDEVAPYLAIVDQRCQDAGQPLINYFQVLTAMAFAAFADAPVDVAVVEVGLGGAWDSTNVADGQVAVITPVAVDHERLLGSTVQQIATEKAGIIKPGAVAVIGQQHPDAAAPLLRRAADVGADVVLEGEHVGVLSRQVAVGGQLVSVRGIGSDYPDLFLPLYGEHQAHNLTLAVAAVEAFVGGGGDPLDLDLLRAAVAGMDSPGRIEVVRSSPTVVIDAAHNPAGAHVLAATIDEAFAFTRLVGVVGVLADKDAEGILAALEPVLDDLVVTRTSSPRSLQPEELAVIARDVFDADQVHVGSDLPQALALAVDLTEAGGDLGGGVLATGSVTMAADVRALLGRDDRVRR
ncbi:MAG: bifunctional folylpolyglutamate synthase/dihydrofolate synthase [Angustibacter sp.]